MGGGAAATHTPEARSHREPDDLVPHEGSGQILQLKSLIEEVVLDLLQLARLLLAIRDRDNRLAAFGGAAAAHIEEGWKDLPCNRGASAENRTVQTRVRTMRSPSLLRCWCRGACGSVRAKLSGRSIIEASITCRSGVPYRGYLLPNRLPVTWISRQNSEPDRPSDPDRDQ